MRCEIKIILNSGHEFSLKTMKKLDKLQTKYEKLLNKELKKVDKCDGDSG